MNAKPNEKSQSNVVTSQIENKVSPPSCITIHAGLTIRRTKSASRTALRFTFFLAAVVFLLSASAFTEEPALPSFIEVRKKYNFAVAVDAKTAKWVNVTGTVTELDSAGWITIRDDSGPVRHLNMRQVFFVTEAR